MTYKLIYFDIKGRGEDARLIMTYAGVKFRDVRVKEAEWDAMKSATPWDQLPLLEVNGKKLAQSMTICRYLAKKFKLTGKDDWEEAKCEEYVDALSDLVNEWVKFTFEPDQEKKQALKSTFASTNLPKYLKRFNTIKHENGGDYLVGKEITWADIVLADKLERLESDFGANFLNSYPHLRKLKEVVLGCQQLKDYVAGRGPGSM